MEVLCPARRAAASVFSDVQRRRFMTNDALPP